jgi:hypothetical protein
MGEICAPFRNQLSSSWALFSQFPLSTHYSQVRNISQFPLHVLISLSDQQLSKMLTGVLAIPIADALPTPNARKTCALSIWFLQTQRLPSQVIEPAATRVAYALRRGVDGELGKEGKKGSSSDGLKVQSYSFHSDKGSYPRQIRRFVIFLYVNPLSLFQPSPTFYRPSLPTSWRQALPFDFRHVTLSVDWFLDRFQSSERVTTRGWQ